MPTLLLRLPLSEQTARRILSGLLLVVYVLGISALPVGPGALRPGCRCSREARSSGSCCCSAPSGSIATSKLPPCCQAKLAQSQPVACCLRGAAADNDDSTSDHPALRRCGCGQPVDDGYLLNTQPRLALQSVRLPEAASGLSTVSVCDELSLSRRFSPPTPPPKSAC